jgi:lipoate-protein ligase A
MRLLDLGAVPWIESQSIHHAIARTFTEQTPDTLVIVRPDQAYICLGRHSLGASISPDAAQRIGLPIVRRQLGGGAVLITPDQTFFVFIVHQKRLPLPDRAAFAWGLSAGVAAYHRLGVEAEIGPGTDITGSGRKLCGSGAASIGEAAVFGGNIIHDFDPARFLEVVITPSRAIREALAEEISAQMGSVRHLTGVRPTGSEVAAAVAGGVEDSCDVSLVPGRVTDIEAAAVPATEAWLRRVPAAGLRSAPPYWKVRSGAGVLRMTLTQSGRHSFVVRVRESRLAAVSAERPEGATLARTLNDGLSGCRINEGLAEVDLAAVGVPGAVTSEITTWLQRLAQWVT